MENTSAGPTSGSVSLQQSCLDEATAGGSTSESLPRASPIINPPTKTTGRNRSGNSKFFCEYNFCLIFEQNFSRYVSCIKEVCEFSDHFSLSKQFYCSVCRKLCRICYVVNIKYEILIDLIG